VASIALNAAFMRVRNFGLIRVDIPTTHLGETWRSDAFGCL